MTKKSEDFKADDLNMIRKKQVKLNGVSHSIVQSSKASKTYVKPINSFDIFYEKGFQQN